ncbi:MAG: hypothetical protein Q8P58_00580 [Candidatus Adlerbacteria bacterium]|nr:hypothetical protein [Candidatus Adlerbacteria bacterium]
MQFSRAGLIVLREGKPKIYTRLHQLAEYSIIALVAAGAIPTKNYDSLEIALTQPLHEPVELGAVHAILNCVAVSKRQLYVLFKAGMSLRNDAVGAKAFKRKCRDRQTLSKSEASVFRLLVLNGVFLVVSVVGALAIVNQVALAVLAAFHVGY